MKFVICHLMIEGFHFWKNAPQHLNYLSLKHRHIFDIRIKFVINNNDREIEIIETQNKITQYLLNKYSKNNLSCDFNGMSCEDIAEEILNNFNAFSVQVLEDGFGGAEIVRE